MITSVESSIGLNKSAVVPVIRLGNEWTVMFRDEVFDVTREARVAQKPSHTVI